MGIIVILLKKLKEKIIYNKYLNKKLVYDMFCFGVGDLMKDNVV